ncbi:MAG: 30S ribosomal protein S16 [Balneola sp.]|nr:MAG: 30S ribosomal protein S16 [Balneola sp.]
MIKIRLQRKGRIRRPIYHIVVADSRSPRDGRIIEQVGRYDGVTEKKETVLNEDRIMYWLDTGAQPTDSVRKILRQEGLLYKRHLVMWGKSEEEIDAALAEWKAYRDSKKETEVTRKEQVQASLAAEEKAVKENVAKKAAKAAAELAEEATAEAEATEATEEVAEEATAETTEEAVAETVEETTDEVVEEPAETTEEVVVEAVAEEPVAEVEETEEATEEEVVAEASTDTQVSSDLTAKEAIDHINNTDLADLAGFVTDAEDRKTVLAAWEAKQAG